MYCTTDYGEKFAPRCKDCGKPIVAEPGETSVSRLVVNGEDWHPSCYKAKGDNNCIVCKKDIASGAKIRALGSVFHAKCFCCVECGKDLSGNDDNFQTDDKKNIYKNSSLYV